MARSTSTTTYLTVADNNDFSPSVTDLTIMIWARNGDPSHYLVGKGGSFSCGWEWALQQSGTNLLSRSWICSGASTHSAASVTNDIDDGNWHLCGGDYDHLVETKVFSDINTASDTVFGGTMSNTTRTVTIGRRGDTVDPWQGDHAMFVMWKTLLNPNSMIALGLGVNPIAVGESDNMTVWIPEWGYNSPEEDWSGLGRTASLTGSPGAVRDGPPVELVEKYM